jgi:hypothetical protein
MYAGIFAKLSQIGIHAPSEGAILDGCRAMLIGCGEEYAEMQVIYQARQASAVERMNSGNYTSTVAYSGIDHAAETFNAATWSASIKTAAEVSRQYLVSIGQTPVSNVNDARIASGTPQTSASLQSLVDNIDVQHVASNTKDWAQSVSGVFGNVMDGLRNATLESVQDIMYDDFADLHSLLKSSASTLHSYADELWDRAAEPTTTTLEHAQLEARAHAAEAAALAIDGIEFLMPHTLPQAMFDVAIGEVAAGYKILGGTLSMAKNALGKFESLFGESGIQVVKAGLEASEARIRTNIETISMMSSGPVKEALSTYEIKTIQGNIGHVLERHIGKSDYYNEYYTSFICYHISGFPISSSKKYIILGYNYIKI